MTLFFPDVWLPWQRVAQQFQKFNFSQRHVILVLCAKFHDNHVKTAEVTSSRIFPQKCYHANDDSAHTKNNWRLCFINILWSSF